MFRKCLLILLSALAGFAVATAARRFQDMEKRQLTLGQAEASVELLEARTSLLQTYLDEMEEKARFEPEAAQNLEYARYERRLVERDLTRARLNLEETLLTGKSADDSLTAPIISGRDFVTERLLLELERREERGGFILRDFENARSRAVNDSDPHLLVLEREASMAEQAEGEVRELLGLRESFLAREKTAEEVAILTGLAQAEKRLQAALERLRHVQAASQHLESQEAPVSSMEERQMDFEQTVARIEARLAQMELEYLRSRMDSR